MNRVLGRRAVFAALAALLIAVPAPAQQAEPRGRKTGGPQAAGGPPRAVAPAHQHAAGVIIKTEPARSEASDKGRAMPVRLTINTAAVWRDWFRDQVGQSPGASRRADVERGASSVATTGEPRTEDTEVVIEVDAHARVETLFRNVDGAARPDAATPEEARAESTGAGRAPGEKNRPISDAAAGDQGRGRESKVTRFAMNDLKPGLFVEVDFRQAEGRNRATTVAVIRPVGGLEAAPARPTAAPEKPRSK